MTITEAIPEFLAYLRDVARRSPATIRAYRTDLERFQRFLGDQPLRLSRIDPPTVERWIASMRDLSNATVRRALNALSSFFTWAIRFGHTDANPVDRVERPSRRKRIQPCPSPAEVCEMLAATRNDHERAVLLAMATSGLRRAEALGLRWGHVDLPRRRMTIDGKGSKQRQVPIFEELLEALYVLRAEIDGPPTGAVFRGRQGGSLGATTLQRWMTHWLTEADLRDEHGNAYTLHSLRRFAAKQWLTGGLNIRQVQLLLGHEDLQTTMLYLSYDFEELQREAIDVDFGLRSQTVLR
ncbi:MAG: tyrosine-type recombinase/integrase [Armatimonadota bacterium]